MGERLSARCPFCGDVIKLADASNYAYVRSMFILHFDACPQRPAELEDEQKRSVADHLYEALLDEYR